MNKQINEYKSKPKTMEQWVLEAKKHLAELKALRKKVEQTNENK